MSVAPLASESGPKVSVCMITYNHEKYIGQAIDSVLMQETSFAYELVIGEDCSADRTREMVLRYERERPAIVRVLCHEKNLGMLRNLATTLEACRGEYIALLEGDDYWTASVKLQRQVEILDACPDIAICFHQAMWIREDGSQASFAFPQKTGTSFGLEDLLRDNFIPTCSVMFRSLVVKELPPWFYTLRLGDWPLHILNARRGRIVFIPEPLSVYRIHSAGAWALKNWSEQLSAAAEMFLCVQRHLGHEYRHIIQETLFSLYYWLGFTAVSEGNNWEARQWARKCLTALGPMKELRRKVYLGLQVYAPRAFSCARAIKRALYQARIAPGK